MFMGVLATPEIKLDARSIRQVFFWVFFLKIYHAIKPLTPQNTFKAAAYIFILFLYTKVCKNKY